MDDIAELLTHITLGHVRLRFLLHYWPIETLCHNSVAQLTPADVCTTNPLVDMLDDSLNFPLGIHLRYDPENDYLHSTSFIKEYLTAQASTLIASRGSVLG